MGNMGQVSAVEDLYFFHKAARRLGYEFLRMWEWYNDPEEAEHGEQWEVIQRLNDAVNANGGGQETLAELAQDLREEGDDSGMGEERAAELLRQQVVLEQYENHGPREPDFHKLWGWAAPFVATRGKCKFFALNRWPLELQNEQRQVEIMASGPDELVEKRRAKNLKEQEKAWEEGGEDGDIAAGDNERETYYPGECFFPFGETPFQRAYQSWQIEAQLKTGKFYKS